MIVALGVAAFLAGCSTSPQELADEKAKAQDQAAQAELDACNAQYKSPVSREDAIPKLNCMDAAYRHFSRKPDDLDEAYFVKNLAFAEQYSVGKISYEEMRVDIDRNLTDLTNQRQILAAQAGSVQKEEEDAKISAQAERAQQETTQRAETPDNPDDQ